MLEQKFRIKYNQGSMEDSNNSHSKWWIVIPLGIAVLHIMYALYTGPKISPDGKKYAYWAEVLIAEKFNPLRFLDNVTHGIPPVLYIGIVYIIALCKYFLGSYWALGVVVFNGICSAGTVLVLFKLLKSSFKTILPPVVITLWFLGCYEWFQWIGFVLTDTAYGMLSFLTIHFLLKGYRNHLFSGDSIKYYWAPIAGLAILGTFFRPSTPPLFALIFLVFLVSLNPNPEKRIPLAKRLFLTTCGAIIFALPIHAYIIQSMIEGNIPIPLFMEETRNTYLKGIVIYDRPETYHEVPRVFGDYLLITLDRMVSFFSISADAFSLKHKILNYVYFVPIYFFSLITIFRLFQKNNSWPTHQLWMGWLSLFFIVVSAVFHSMSYIDYDWRLRVPCLIPLLVTACLGFDDMLSRLTGWGKRPVNLNPN